MQEGTVLDFRVCTSWVLPYYKFDQRCILLKPWYMTNLLLQMVPIQYQTW